MNSKLIDKCLRATISKDETRSYLQGVYFNSKSGEAVSTDECALTVSKSRYVEEFADMIVDFKSMNVIRREFLKYQSVIPKKFKHVGFVSIGKNVDIKQRRVEYKAYFKDNAFIISDKEVEGFQFALDPKFLNPLIGYTLEVKFNDPLNPVTFVLKEDDSYYIVMPTRV